MKTTEYARALRRKLRKLSKYSVAYGYEVRRAYRQANPKPDQNTKQDRRPAGRPGSWADREREQAEQYKDYLR